MEEEQKKTKEERKKIIMGIIGAAVLIAGGVLLQRFVFQEPDVSYVPSNFDQESCVTKEIEEVKPNQELCKDSPDLIPAKTYYSEGWKVVCCQQNKNNQ